MSGGSLRQYTHTMTNPCGQVVFYRKMDNGEFCIWSRMFTKDDWGWWKSSGTSESALKQRSLNLQCSRCREIKDYFWFPAEMKSWNQQCNRCLRTPIGEMPLPQKECDRR